MADRRQSIRTAYDDLAETYDEERSDEPPEPLWALVDRLADGSRVLDAGCGQGRPVLATLASEFEAVGLDFSREQLELARTAAPDAALVQGDVTTLPFAGERFDAVCSFYTLIHVPNEKQGRTLREFARVLRPDGWLLCSVGTDEWTGRNPDWLDSGVEMRWSFAGLEATREHLADAGFSVEAEWTVPDELGGEFPVLLARLERPSR